METSGIVRPWCRGARDIAVDATTTTTTTTTAMNKWTCWPAAPSLKTWRWKWKQIVAGWVETVTYYSRVDDLSTAIQAASSTSPAWTWSTATCQIQYVSHNGKYDVIIDRDLDQHAAPFTRVHIQSIFAVRHFWHPFVTSFSQRHGGPSERYRSNSQRSTAHTQRSLQLRAGSLSWLCRLQRIRLVSSFKFWWWSSKT